MKRIGTRVGAALLALGGVAWATTAAIPMLLPGDRVRGALSTLGGRKYVAFAGVEGSTLALSAKALRGSHVQPVLTLLEPDGTPLDLGDTNPKSVGRASAKHIALGATGVWRIGVATPAGAGGDFELAATAKVPLTFSWPGSLADGASVADHLVPAAPGGTITVSVAAKGKPAFDPTVELLAPSGGSLAKVTGLKGRATIRAAALGEHGRYTVRVTGGPGAFTARAAVKPGKKSTRAYRDVEAAPGIWGFTPAATTNDTIVRFDLNGFAFTMTQTARVVDGASVKAAAPLTILTPSGAAADIDLAGVPPGTYGLRVDTPDGATGTAPNQFVVTNRNPVLTGTTPVEASNQEPFTLDVRGAGFDAASTLSLRRTADALTIPFTIASRGSHTTITAHVTPSAYVTGPCDVEVRDPDGKSAVLAGGLDLLGFRAAPAVLRQLTGADAASGFTPRDSAYDATNGRVLLSLYEGKSVALVLFDPATLTVVDTLVLSVADFGISGTLQRPRVAWDRVTGTFAVGLVAGQANQGYAIVRVVTATNLHDTRLQSFLVSAIANVSEVTPAANDDDGGYLVVWEQGKAAYSNDDVKAQVITPLLTLGGPPTTIASNPTGPLAQSVLAYQGNRRFVVAWMGPTKNSVIDFAIHATVVDAAGVQTSDGPYVTATSTAWAGLLQPEIAANPDDGSMLVAFTYVDGNVPRPAVQRLAPGDARPGPYSAIAGGTELLAGYTDSIRWNPARGEFVLAMTLVSVRVAVRRVDPDGTIRAAPVLESYEGIWGILWAGPQAGQFGLARAFDGVADGLHDMATQLMQIVAGPSR